MTTLLGAISGTEHLAELMPSAARQGLALRVLPPNCPPDEVEGVVVTNQGKYVHGLWVEERADGRGFPYYWLRFGRQTAEMKPGTDMAAVNEKRISVTPLKLDLTAHEVKDSLAKALA